MKIHILPKYPKIISKEPPLGKFEIDCPQCDGKAIGEGLIKDDGELVRSHYIECSKCGWDQAS
ncbi:MAG: hypothetical protein CMM02_18195 [Rhodopirellula sp.]|nr:hypothetical protein [Rhodopirellula sp.]|tara:strand:- start:3685 stop:3873 length:189 start_codon:yes stop_codon:yes gene_type:complete